MKTEMQNKAAIWQASLTWEGQPCVAHEEAAAAAEALGWRVGGAVDAAAGVWLVAIPSVDRAELRREGGIDRAAGGATGSIELP